MVSDRLDASQDEEAKRDGGNYHHHHHHPHDRFHFSEHEKRVLHERKWDYEHGNSTGMVTMAEIRRSPYFTRMRNMSPGTKTLADADVKELHRRGWTSRVSVYDMDASLEARLPAPERAMCSFKEESQEYLTYKVEELRLRVLETSVPFGSRLVVVEDLTPPVMEMLGYSLDVHPGIFDRHIGHSWGDRSTVINPLYIRRGLKSPMEFAIPYPRLFQVSHPSALRHMEWRTDCLKLAARHLQCRQLLPALDSPEENKVQCIAFEHITVSMNVDPKEKGKYGALVLFPSSLKHWEDGNLRVSKHQNIDQRPGVLDMLLQTSDTADMDIAAWEASLKLMGAVGNDLADPLLVLESLLKEALGHWKVHLVHIALCINFLSTPSEGQVEEHGLQPEQQLRAIIHQGVSVISGILENIASANEVHGSFENDNKGYGATAESARFSQLEKDFTVIKQQLERHLPTLQHHIDVIRVNQQVRLAETQLEESRKAIQQADTIKRLTILAFVYIPIQTSATIFGMNVREFGSEPSVWAFALLTVVLLAITLCAAGWRHIVSFCYRQENKTFGSFRTLAANTLGPMGIRMNAKSSNNSLDKRLQDPEPSWYL